MAETKQVRKLAEKYFGGFEAGEKSSRSIPEEPVQKQEKSLVMKLDSEPWYVEGYHVPAFGAPEYPVSYFPHQEREALHDWPCAMVNKATSSLR